MDKAFPDDELLYRAVYPPEHTSMFWKDNGHVSSAAFLDKKRLSVERGNFRPNETVFSDMKKFFTGRIVSFAVKLCRDVEAFIVYKPTRRSIFHTEVHGNKKQAVLSPSQRRYLALNCEVYT